MSNTSFAFKVPLMMMASLGASMEVDLNLIVSPILCQAHVNCITHRFNYSAQKVTQQQEVLQVSEILTVNKSITTSYGSLIGDRSDEDVDDSGSGGGGYWNIQLSPSSITSVPFGPGHISVWEHTDSPGR